VLETSSVIKISRRDRLVVSSNVLTEPGLLPISNYNIAIMESSQYNTTVMESSQYNQLLLSRYSSLVYMMHCCTHNLYTFFKSYTKSNIWGIPFYSFTETCRVQINVE